VRVGRALIAGAIVVAAVLVAVALSRVDAQSGSNSLTPQQFVAEVGPGETLCQSGEQVPAPTGALKMTVATFGRPEPDVEVTLREGGRVVSRGGLRAGAWEQGVVRIPISAVRRPVTGARLCLRNPGRGRLAIGGERVGPFAVTGGERQDGRAAVVYLRPGRDTWLGSASEVVGRFGHGRADLLGGGWTLWAGLAAMLLAFGAAARALLLEGRG
jgi:hypothetical protein